MLSRAAVLLVVALASTGCLGIGFGQVVPGAASRKPDRAAKTHGGLGAMRFGTGGIRIGDRPEIQAFAFDIRAEYQFEATPQLGLGGSLGYQFEGTATGEVEACRYGVPLTAIATVVPVRPFVLRLGGLIQRSTVEVDLERTSGISRGVVIGVGVNAQFRRVHLVAAIDWQLSSAGTVLTPAGPAAYRSDLFLLDLWVIGW